MSSRLSLVAVHTSPDLANRRPSKPVCRTSIRRARPRLLRRSVRQDHVSSAAAALDEPAVDRSPALPGPSPLGPVPLRPPTHLHPAPSLAPPPFNHRIISSSPPSSLIFTTPFSTRQRRVLVCRASSSCPSLGLDDSAGGRDRVWRLHKGFHGGRLASVGDETAEKVAWVGTLCC